MDIMQLCSVLSATTSADAGQRHAAEEALKQHQHIPGQSTNLLRVAVEGSVDAAVRQVAAITFKNLVKADWDAQDEGKGSSLPEADRAAVRDNLLQGIVRAPPAVRSQLGECAKFVVHTDYPEHWPALLPSIVAHLSTQDHAQLYCGMLMLRLLTRKYEFKDEDEREPLAQIVSVAFPPLLAIFQGLLAGGSVSPEAAQLLKLGFKAFWSASYMEIPAPLAEPTMFAEWMTVLHTFITQPVPEGQPEDLEARRQWPWWKAMKWALHITHRLFNRYGDPKKLEANSPDQAFATLFRDQCAVKFLEAHTAMLGRYAEGQWLSPRVVNLTLQYLTVGIRQARTWKLLQPHVPELMQRVLFPLMCFGDEDQELWDEDPLDYIRKGYDIMEEMYSPKSAASNFLHELCEARQKNLEPCMQQISAIFTEQQAAAAGGGPVPQQIARRMDGALLAVGALSDILKQKENYKKSLEGMLMTHVAPLFQSSHGHLRAKAAWVAGTYADIKFVHGGFGSGQHFSALFRCVVAALSDSELPVRVDAVMAARSFIDAYSEEAVGEIKGLIPALLDQIFKLMQEVDNEDLVLTLEAIVEKFEDEMAPFAVGLTQHLAAAFWRATAAEEEAESEEDGLGAYNVLRTLATVLESVSSQPALFHELEGILFPIMQRMISQDGQDVFEEVLELLAYFTYCSPTISPQLWSLWPQIVTALNDWAVDFFENVLVVLDNYISRGTDVFLTCKQPDYLASVNQIAAKFLSASPEDFDEADIIHAPKLMEVVLQNCRGRMDAVVAPYLQLALQRYGTARKKLMQDLLLNVVASAFYYNAGLAMGALRQAGAVQHAFAAWLGGINADGKHFRRLYDKKVQVLGLLAVLALPDAELPPEVAAGAHDILAAIIKLLSAYREQQTLEELENGSDDESVEDSEVDSDEGDDVDFDEVDEAEERQHANGGLAEDEDEAGGGDEAYMERLARIRERIKAGSHDESEDDSEWTEDEEVSTPVDPVDPFLAFSDAVRHLQSAHPARFQGLASGRGQEQVAAVHVLLQHAEKVRAKKAAEAAAVQQALTS